MLFNNVTRYCARPMCTSISQRFRTNETSPSNHTVNDTAKFYKIPLDVKKQLFTYGGIPKSYNIQLKTFTEDCLMIREPSLDIINCLNHIDYSKPMIKFVIYGKPGTGKSLSLAHILHYALEKNFLIIHVPWVGSWMRRCKEYSNSLTKEGYIDLNLDAAAWLVHFKTQNAHILKNPDLLTSQDHIWSIRETTAANSPLLELVEHGINRVKYASDCVVVLAEEIKRLSLSGKCKTFIAIDGFNAFFHKNIRIWTEKKEKVTPNQVVLTEAFLNLTKSDWNNSIAVLTVDELAITKEDQLNYLPRYLLGKDGFDHLDPFIPVGLADYNDKELNSCLDYYVERKWIRNYDDLPKELSFVAASNPYKIMNLCASL